MNKDANVALHNFAKAHNIILRRKENLSLGINRLEMAIGLLFIFPGLCVSVVCVCVCVCGVCVVCVCGVCVSVCVCECVCV